jgi:hypothetical protein
MTRPRIFLFDIDGTLAKRRHGGRGPFDWDRVGEDLPNEPIMHVARSLLSAGECLMFVSGRLEVCRTATVNFLTEHLNEWLDANDVDGSLWMRPDTDRWRYAKDVELKAWIYETAIEPRFEVVAVFDDRDQVVQMWRERDVTCLQVSNGNF